MAHSRSFTILIFVAGIFLGASNLHGSEGAVAVSIVADSEPGPGAQHGLRKLGAALQKKGVSFENVKSRREAGGRIEIVAGLGNGSGATAKLLKAMNIKPPQGAESLLIRDTKRRGKKVVVVSGADDRGLMYALLDIADRIGWASDSENPLSEVRNAKESPAVSERALSIYTMQRKHVESFFHDEEYWSRYLDMLARNRFSTFVLIFGYSPAAYLAPPYPYFFDVDGFSEIRFEGLTAEQQRRNLRALNRIIEMTHERGLDFTLGIWDHIPRKNAKGVPVGLSRDKLLPYTKAALAKLLRLVPKLDALQFRMHGESGLTRSEMEGFWPAIYQVILDSGRNIRLDARAKNFPDSLIYKAQEMGLEMRMCTKYWMEQMGMPFHPTHIHPNNQRDRRHGYADMLRYPQRYKMHWKLWNGGTTRIFLWGDPDYARRFAESTHLYDGEGFEINEPLATKMAMHPDDEPFELLGEKYRYYDWEFERYWHFYQVFGRLGYNPKTPPEVWSRQFERRFGSEAGPYVQRALHRASKVLPRIVSYNYPYNLFPTLTGWAEMRRQDDLPKYAAALPSDTQQFLSMDEAAENIIEGRDSAKMLPSESSQWFARTASYVLRQVEEAEKRVGDNASKEFNSTVVDLKMLAHLSRYHSWRARAGVSYALYERTGDLAVFGDAIRQETRAIDAWEQMVAAASDVYHDNMMFGRNMPPHWKDELAVLKKGLVELKKQRKNFKPPSAGVDSSIAHVPVRKAPPGDDILIRATAGGAVRVGYRDAQGNREFAPVKRVGRYFYRATIPGRAVAPGLSYWIEAASESGRRNQADAIDVDVTTDNEPPTVTHKAVAEAPAEKSLTISATVRDPAGIEWVRLRYRSVNQHQDFRALTMLASGEGRYQATVPGEHIVPEWDFMYLIEVMDKHGNGTIYPDLEKETPYIVVKLKR